MSKMLWFAVASMLFSLNARAAYDQGSSLEFAKETFAWNNGLCKSSTQKSDLIVANPERAVAICGSGVSLSEANDSINNKRFAGPCDPCVANCSNGGTTIRKNKVWIDGRPVSILKESPTRGVEVAGACDPCIANCSPGQIRVKGAVFIPGNSDSYQEVSCGYQEENYHNDYSCD